MAGPRGPRPTTSRQRSAKHNPGEVCPRCQAVHKTHRGGNACVAHKRNDPTTGCTKDPKHGQRVCYTHGGAAPQAAAAGAQRETERKAFEIMQRFGEPIDTTPTEALLDAVKWTAGYVAWLRDKVASADSDNGLTQHSLISGKREASVWLDLLAHWSDRLVKVCSEAIRCGIEERRVKLAEQHGKLLADVIRGILGDLNLTPEQEAMVSDVVPRHLRLVAG